MRSFSQTAPLWIFKFVYPVLAACSIFLAFEQYNLFPTLFLLPVFLHGMRKLPMRSKLLSFWIMAIVTNIGGFNWIHIVATDFGGLPTPVAWLLVLVFGMFNNLNFVLWAYLDRFFGESGNPFKTALFFCVAEQLNPQVFPWYFGTGLDSVLVFYQTADLWGVIGLSFVAMVLIHTPWWLWRNRKGLLNQHKRISAALIFFLALICGYGIWALWHYDNHASADRKAVNISLIQANTSMEKSYGQRKTEAERFAEFQNLLALSEQAVQSHTDSVDLVIWPEGGIHFPVLQTPAVLDAISNFARRNNLFVSAGSAEFVGQKPNGRWEYYNSQFIFDPNGQVAGKYRKIVLLAFGEYIPLVETFPAIEDWLPDAISHFSRGEQKPIFPLKDNISWLPLICYEDIIFGFMAGFDHRRADFLVNTTNDGWFGKSDASHLHKQMARPRTVEFRKPMVRTLNTGVSLVIDAAGRTISRETGLYTQEFINTTLNLPAKPPVTLYSMIGNWPIYILIGLVSLFWGRKKFFLTQK